MGVKSVIDRGTEWFVTAFGSSTHMAIASLLLLAWFVPVFFIGFHQWNSGIGLAGNNYESTAEYFLEVAILYTASKIDRRHGAQFDRIEEMEKRILDKLEEHHNA